MIDYVTSWWERVGHTDWSDTASGSRVRYGLFRNIQTGETRISTELPIGALYAVERDADLPIDAFPPAGPDGLSIVCVLLGGGGPRSRHHWYIDYRASNCTMPGDARHRCWVRHGTVGDRLTVDKQGLTCGAGAGSFYMDGGRWHGFLIDGVLVQR